MSKLNDLRNEIRRLEVEGIIDPSSWVENPGSDSWRGKPTSWSSLKSRIASIKSSQMIIPWGPEDYTVYTGLNRGFLARLTSKVELSDVSKKFQAIFSRFEPTVDINFEHEYVLFQFSEIVATASLSEECVLHKHEADLKNNEFFPHKWDNFDSTGRFIYDEKGQTRLVQKLDISRTISLRLYSTGRNAERAYNKSM